jgi:hypothetical protein
LVLDSGFARWREHPGMTARAFFPQSLSFYDPVNAAETTPV